MKASEALCPLRQTICHLQNSSRFSIDSPTLEILTSAQNAVASTLKLLETLEVLRDGNGSNKICGLEDDIRDSALELEDVVASHVSDQILSLSESESILAGDQPLLFSLDLQGVRNDIYGFTEKMKKIERELNPWFEEQDSDIFALKSDENGVTRARVMSWFATKAASIFVGDEEEYIQDLENLFSKEEQDGTDEKGYAFLLTSNLKDYQPGSSQSRMKYKLIRWWMDKACSISGMNEPEEENIQELYHPLTKADRDEDDDDNVAINMVGLEDLFCEIRDKLLEDKNACSYVGIVGMAGIGKTVLAKNILQDPLVSSKFEHHLFVRVGQKYQEKEVMQAIVAQLNPEMLVAGEDDLFGCLYNTLQGRKCLIVLDDVWNKGFLFDIIERIPYDKGSRFLLMTRIHGFPHEGVVTYTVPFLNLKESWDLLRGEIFGEQRCPPQLEKAGMKIAENCEGLPLLILTVAHFLSRAEKTLEYWNEVSANKTNSIFIQAYEQILEAVRPSYYLPQNLKTCFLYMGAFPQNAKVRNTKLINLYSAEGFLDLPYRMLQRQLDDYFRSLVNHTVALDSERGYVSFELKNASVDGIQSRRRLSVYKNILFSVEDVRDSIASLPAVRSLLCTGPYHEYQVPICFGLRLLKVLDVLSIRFYEFPLEVVKLFHLRYLALTCNGSLPPSISKLWNLQFLIVNQHQRIKNVSESYLPVEIWELQELEYLQIMGRNLPEPPHSGAVLRNLVKLLDVGAYTCTKRVLTILPNLKKLRVQIEATPAAQLPSFNIITGISHIISSLHCVVANPTLVSHTVAPPLSAFTLVRKVSLSGLGYSWKDMSKISRTPFLFELRLKCYAFRGETWEVAEGDFPSLSELTIEDTDLVKWSGRKAFRFLCIVTIKHCYKLQEFPDLLDLQEMQVVDCHPSVKAYAQNRVRQGWPIHVESSSMAK